ncbi:MAG: hypothetical protein ACFFG0_04880 [Candidatus Thorarchaeota archaeon]
MGLDMYLEAKRFLWSEERKNIKIENIEIPKDCEIQEIKIEVGYWRKANQIHNWFVNNVQDGKDDCEDYYVSKDKLEKLLSVCKEVLSQSKLVKGTVRNGESYTPETGWKVNYEDGQIIVDSSIAEELLPTTSGCFFGNTGYNEWYLDDIKDTIEIIEKALKLPKGWELYYNSSW